MDDGFKNREFWLAGELAKAADVSTDTLRHYERKGVLKIPERGVNGYRLYPESALDRVKLVRRALSFGFTLDELARILSERDKGGAPCRKVRELVSEKLLNVEEQLFNLAALRDDLRLTLEAWDTRLLNSASDTKLGLLENFVSASANNNQTQPTDNKKKENPFPHSNFKKKGKNT